MDKGLAGRGGGMKIKITLPGSIRSKKNSKIATIIGGANKPRRAMILSSKAYKKWEKIARVSAAIQYPGEPMTCPVAVKALIFYKGQRPDLSGCLESVGDCCQGLIWGDDKQIESWDGSRLAKDNANPRTEIEVVEYADE